MAKKKKSATKKKTNTKKVNKTSNIKEEKINNNIEKEIEVEDKKEDLAKVINNETKKTFIKDILIFNLILMTLIFYR